MPVPGNPVAPLVVGQTYSLQAPIAPTTAQRWTVELDNVSPYPLTIGGSLAAAVLPPMQSQTYTAPSGPAGVTFTVNAPPDNSVPPAGVPAYLTNTWAILPDTIQGVFPMAIPPTTLVIGQQQYNAGSFTVTAGHGATVPVPVWAQSAIIYLTESSGILSVQGASTGLYYLGWTAASAISSNSNAGMSCPVAAEVDSEISIIAFPSPGPSTSTFTVIFSSGPPVIFPEPQQFIIGAVIQDSLTAITVLSETAPHVVKIKQVTMVATGGNAATDYYGGNLTATLLGSNVNENLLGMTAQGLTVVSATISPNIFTYPGSSVVLTPEGPTGPNGQLNVNIQYEMPI